MAIKPNLRVGCAAGFSGDRTDAAGPIVDAMLATGGPSVLIFETLAERTLALAQLAGIVTVCATVSVLVVPRPSSHAFHDPVRAGSVVLLLTTPVVADHGEGVPVSKPGLPSSCCAVQLAVGVALASLLCGPSPMEFTALTL